MSMQNQKGRHKMDDTIYYKYEYWQFKGDNRKFKTEADILETCKGASWRINQIKHCCAVTINKKTAHKYNVIQII